MLLLLVAPAAAQTLPVNPALLAADDKSLWLVTLEEGGFHVAAASRPQGKDWPLEWTRWPGTFSSEPVAAAANRQSLVVLFPDGDVIEFFLHAPQPRQGLRIPPELWPLHGGSRIIAACAEDPGTGAVLVLAARPASRRPATGTATSSTKATSAAATATAATTRTPAWAAAPATASTLAVEAVPGSASRPSTRAFAGPNAAELLLLRYDHKSWQLVGQLPQRSMPKHALMAWAAGSTYILLDESPRQWLVFGQNEWPPPPAPAWMNKAAPLALAVEKDRFRLAVHGLPDAGDVAAATAADGQWAPPQPVMLEGKALNFLEPPRAAWMGAELALAWRQGANWQYTLVAPDGQARAPAGASLEQRSQVSAGQIQVLFLLTVSGLSVVLLFWRGQPLRAAAFVLPQGVEPASLMRRGAAFAIDFVPFMVAASLWLNVQSEQELRSLLKDPSARVAWAYVGGMSAYVLCAIVSEYARGATLGKRLLRLRVVGAAGGRLKLREAVLRNLLKVVEMLPYLLPLTVVIASFSAYRQRLGDRLASTAVVDADTLPPPLPPPPPPPPPPEAGDSP